MNSSVKQKINFYYIIVAMIIDKKIRINILQQVFIIKKYVVIRLSINHKQFRIVCLT